MWQFKYFTFFSVPVNEPRSVIRYVINSWIFGKMQEYTPPGEEVPDKPTKDELNVAKWMRKNVPIKRTKFLNHNVEYFTGRNVHYCTVY